ncbi:MAG TPA: hypothetical protein VHB79_03860 [Polyangiaceae bacterium]|nr:hypothetical protein [Polyangiaceae bacterium]
MLVSRRHEHWPGALALALASLHCTPDFDSLSRGHGVGGTSASAGGSNDMGGSENIGGFDGSRGGSEANDAGASGGAVAGSTLGPGGRNADAGAAGVAAAPAEGGEAGAGGSAPACVWKAVGSTYSDGFDGGLDGNGFDIAVTMSSMTSTLGATASSEWDEAVGKTCPGALRLEAVFKGYASGQAPDEVAIADLRFTEADWTGRTKLHAWVRVSPVKAPITGVQFFLISGSSYLYKSVFDDGSFGAGQWYELVLPLVPGASYDPKLVQRLGVKITLRRDGAANNPPQAPTVDVWLDDVWVE